MLSNSLYGNYRTNKFSEIYEDYESFQSDFVQSPYNNCISIESLKLTYYLLYGQYGNTPIANSDENQFKFKLFGIIFMYGPGWEKQLEIQNKLRGLTEDDILQGQKQIYNHSFNPSTAPTTGTLTELTTIDDQNTTNVKRSKINAYAELYSVIKIDVTKQYLDRFNNCFIRIVEPQLPLWYETDESEDDE